jgi:hypothetical protein
MCSISAETTYTFKTELIKNKQDLYHYVKITKTVTKYKSYKTVQNKTKTFLKKHHKKVAEIIFFFYTILLCTIKWKNFNVTAVWQYKRRKVK